ncbi:MAG: UPF0182 family protein [Clostridiales Family XIII bacterium]|nr:UPF0182 family protein [Clostridiales Family XIII bacterium]
MKSKRSRIILIILIVVIVLAGLIAGLAGFITNYLWFRDLGYTDVFWKQLLTMLKIGVPVFVVLTALAVVYLKVLRKGYFKRVKAETQTMGAKGQGRVGLLFSVAAAAIVTWMSVTGLWFESLKFGNSTGFDLADPIFGQDISFYVFKLQFIKELNSIVITGIVMFALLTFLYYFFLLSVAKPSNIDGASVDDEPKEAKKAPGSDPISSFLKSLGLNFEGFGGGGGGAAAAGGGAGVKELIHIASRQIIVIGILFFLMVGVNFFLKQYDLLFTNNPPVLFGAGFTDINITLWVYRGIMGLSVLAAIFFAIGVSRRKVKTAIIIPIAMIAVGLLGTGAGMLVQNLIVDPDARNKQSEYIEYNIKYTQNAYGLNDVATKEFPATNNLTKADVVENADSIRNIRINDYEPAKKFYNSQQSIRPYYTFNDVDVDRYFVNGQYTQTFLSARELDYSKVGTEWVNVHLKYTHGYGVVVSRVDKVTASGQPDIMIKNIPPESQIEEIQIDRPEIYFGELQNSYIITNTSEKELNYEQGGSTNYTIYEGKHGIKLGLFNRLLFAIQERSMKLLVSSNIKNDSKIIINRNITQRVRAIMPYLDYADPYMVAVDGKLYWIIDAFTTSNMYPYSEPYAEGNGTNYVRNSVKVVIDAYEGTTDYFIVDEKDPVAATMKGIYPTLFKSFSQMPEGIKAHIRYPSSLLNIQANTYKKYHVNDVELFFQKADFWDIANEKVGASEREKAMTPNYYIMKLPGEKDAEFINSIPYTPAGKVNMAALLIARNDGDHYGEMMLLQLPRGRIINGPAQIDAQIAQDPRISQDFGLWANSDSTYSRGNMFVIPIEDSLMYVEPIYLNAQDSAMPEVKRIIIYYGDRIAYQPTLSAALDEMFGAGTGDAVTDTDADPLVPGGTPGTDTPVAETPGGIAQEGDGQQRGTDELISLAVAAYNNAVAAQKAGDWTKYGEYLAELEGYLNQLNAGGATPAADAAGAAAGQTVPEGAEQPEEDGQAAA